MSAKPATAADHIRTINLVEAQSGGKINVAARKIGIPDSTMRGRYREARAWRNHHGHDYQKAPETIIIEHLKPRVRMQVASPTGSGYKVLAIGDTHDDPHLPKDRFRWFGAHAKHIACDYAVQVGDWATVDSLNAHISNETLQAKTKNPFVDDLVSLQQSIAAFNEGLAGHTCRRVVTLGNHERRAWHFEENNPESAGLLTGPLLAAFEAGGWETRPYGEIFYLGGVGFVHCALNRLGKSYGGKSAENTIANDSVHDLVIGHSHIARQVRVPKIGPYNHVTVLNLGCALPYGHVEDYARDALTGWTWGVYELFIRAGHIESAKFISMLELEERYA